MLSYKNSYVHIQVFKYLLIIIIERGELNKITRANETWIRCHNTNKSKFLFV